MYIANIKTKVLFLSILIVSIFLSNCSTKPKDAFEMQRQLLGERFDPAAGDSSTEKPIYLTDTKPVDSINPDLLIYDIFRIVIDDYPEQIKVYSRVYDSLGNFVTNMADPYRKDTTITYFTRMDEKLGKVYVNRDEEIPIFNVREFGKGDSIAFNIVMSVDYSGSINPVIEAIYEGTEIFVGLKMDYDKIALTSFNNKLDVKVPLMQDSSEILSLYRAKRTQGFGLFSGVYNAIWECMKLFDNTDPDVPRILVIFSDGDDNYSKQEVGELIKKAKEMNINIFTVAFGYSKDEQMRYIAEYTGGKFYKPYTKEEMIAVFKDIYMSLRYHYLITYKPPVFWGFHTVYSTIDVPGMTIADSLVADGEYDTSGFKELNDEFTRPILFDFNMAEVKSESYPIINELVDMMLSWPRLKIEIQGHTDNIGSAEYNQDLSERRAKAVYNLLIDKGIDERRLRYRGFGYSRPISTNDNEEGRAKNRRTQFVIIAK